MGTKRLLAYSALYLLWGGSYLAIRCLVAVVPPLLTAGCRYTLASLVLWAISDWGTREKRPTSPQIVNAVLSGIALLGIIYSAVFWAETRLNSWLVSALYSTSFLWTYLAECLLNRRSPRPAIVAALLTGLTAIPFLLVPGSAAPKGTLFRVAVVLLSAMMWASMLALIRRIDLPRNYRQTAALQLTGAGPFLLLISYLSGEWNRLAPAPELFAWRPVVSMIYLAFGASVLGFSAFHWLLRHDKPYMVSSSCYVNPLVALLAGAVLLHERCTSAQATGALVLFGSICAVWMLREQSLAELFSTKVLLRNGGSTVPDSELASQP